MPVISGALTKDILKWKEQYRDIYYSKIGDNEYIYRLLTRGEYFRLFSFQQYTDSDIVGDFVLSQCLLYPAENINNRLAGEIDYVFQSIINLSGFGRVDEFIDDLNKERNLLSRVDRQIILFICKAFPHLKPEDIDKFTYPCLLQYLAMSEEILGAKLKIEPANNQSQIDFEKDNQSLIGSLPHQVASLKQKRGDVPK